MKVKKLFKLINRECEIEIHGVGSSCIIYDGFTYNTPYYLTQLKVVEVVPLGDDGYNRLSLGVERGEE